MKSAVQKWGNSLAVRIPANYAKDVRIQEGSAVEVTVEENRIVIIPETKGSRLEEMLSRIDENNLHGETDTGGQVGSEIW
ncbi:MAG: AbrB/MazE/SpoVT family DNA-binding domain-containing protein [Brevinematales bacterium]|nr:AbrB/MazE/SpoVT family DNA-binding domain-containing protein [Brevinematales bacterium]